MSFEDVGDVVKLIPVSVADVKSRLESAIKQAEIDLAAIISIKDSDRTFENTALAYDRADAKFSSLLSGFHIVTMTSPDKSLRDVSQESILKASEFSIDKFLTVEIYKAFKSYLETNSSSESLTPERKYYLEEVMKGFKRSGLHLEKAERDHIKSLQKELADLSLKFDRNISEDKSSLHVAIEKLSGISQDFINSLEKDPAGLYILKCDYPTRVEVLKHCSVSETRRDWYKKFMNRAYPVNKDLLVQVRIKRDELAHLLGFSSYAQFDLDEQMAKRVETVESFLTDLIVKVKDKEQKEFELLASDLPAGVTLINGKFYPWDAGSYGYVEEYYRQKHFAVDDREIANYFPVEKTIAGIFDIYQKFLNLDFTILKPNGLWHEDVSLIKICKKGSTAPAGYLFLDLHPRDGKYSHACLAPMISPTLSLDGKKRVVSVAALIANFPKSTPNRPSLLTHGDVTTFFHEFGHGMHNLGLCGTEMSAFAGSSVKHDFVEVPSQMFEEWMWDREMLKRVSCHYKTGQPLPDSLIDKMLELKRFDKGYFVQRQCALALESLYCHKDPNKDIEEIERDLSSIIKHTHYDPSMHNYASFGHLIGYSAKYYCYLWSKVISLDFFDTICRLGLMDGAVGQLMVDKVLGKGGSVDPEKLSQDLLGRAPNQDAFLKDIFER